MNICSLFRFCCAALKSLHRESFQLGGSYFLGRQDITTGVHKVVSQEVIRVIYNSSSDLFSFRFFADYNLNIKLPVTQNMPPATAKCPKCLILDNMLSGSVF